MRRRTSLHEALLKVEGGALTDVARIVVSRRWWDGLPAAMQDEFQRRCDSRGIRLHADAAMSRHYVEVIGDSGGPQLSSEHYV